MYSSILSVFAPPPKKKKKKFSVTCCGNTKLSDSSTGLNVLTRDMPVFETNILAMPEQPCST